MLSKAQSKHIRSLTQQKFRNEHGLFIAEGNKIALEWLNSSANIQMIVATHQWHTENQSLVSKHSSATVITAADHELAAISSLHTPNQVLLVVKTPANLPIPKIQEWYLALDDIQDPGNMGTLIRIADWFGIKHVICSNGCVDIYNPKVVQSAMGSHLRIAFHTASLTETLPTLKVPIYAATLNGTSVYNTTTSVAGILVIGNESRGVSTEVMNIATHKITIPRKGGAESLNAAVSAGIILALFTSQ